MLYRHKMAFKRIVKIPTSTGTKETEQAIPGTAPFYFVSIAPAGAHTILQYAQRKMVVTHNITVRGCPPLETGDVGYFGTRKFKFVGIWDPNEQGIKLEIVAEEIKGKS